jgi:3-deoxy-D-manno-octulosonate 8-phosphate phosphatase (KDO 8-P phosphatase)
MRAAEIGITDIYQNAPVKIPAFEDFIKKHKFLPNEVGFIGDDAIDVAVMRICGFSACPSDAAPIARRTADWVTRSPGGYGAVREIAEIIVSAKTGLYPSDEIVLSEAQKFEPKNPVK